MLSSVLLLAKEDAELRAYLAVGSARRLCLTCTACAQKDGVSMAQVKSGVKYSLARVELPDGKELSVPILEAVGAARRMVPEGQLGLVHISFAGFARRRLKDAEAILTGTATPVFGIDGMSSHGWKPLVELEDMKVARMPIPQVRHGDEPRVLMALIERRLKDEALVLAVPTGDAVLLVRAMERFEDKGVGFREGSKPFKRSKSLTAKMPFVVEFDAGKEGLRVEVVTDPDEEGKLDGAMQCSPKFADLVLRLSTPRISADKEGKRVQEAFERMKRRARSGKWFRVRALVPKCEAFPDGGFLKGHMQVSEALGGVDLLTHRCNVKEELYSTNGLWKVGMEPIHSHGTARLNVQLLGSAPWAFPENEVKNWAVWQLRKVAASVKLGVVPGKLKDIFDSEARLISEGRLDQDSHYLRSRWAALQVFGMGYDFRHCPGLGERYTEAASRSILRRGKEDGSLKLGIEIPCSEELQMVSATFASLCGFPHEVQRGECRRAEGFDFTVVHDDDWEANKANLGGCDLDDYMVHLYRTDEEGNKVVVVFRNPSDRGEYVVYRYVDGDPSPATEVYDASYEKTVLTMSDCRIDLGSAGKQKTQHRKPDMVKKPEKRSLGHDRDSVRLELEAQLHGANPGNFANTAMLWNYTFPGDAGEDRPCTMEEAIDACRQEVNRDMIDAVDAWCGEALKLMLLEEVPIDATLWTKCNFKVPYGMEVMPNLERGLLTRIIEFVELARKQMLKTTAKWLQDQHQIPEVLATKYGRSEGDGYFKLHRDCLLDFRRTCAQTEEKYRKEEISIETRDTLIQEAEAKLWSDVGGDVGTFAYIVHKVKTAKRKNAQGEEVGCKISDNILWTKDFIATYLEVLSEQAPKPEDLDDGLAPVWGSA